MANDMNYTREIVVSVDAETVFKALTKEVGKWWAPKSDVVNEVGDVVKFQFPPTSWTMEVTQLIPDTFIELEVIEANHIDDRVPDSVRQEWLGTKLKWNLHTDEKGTKIHFVHEGLSPQLVCYEVCEAGWDHYFVKELYDFLQCQRSDIAQN